MGGHDGAAVSADGGRTWNQIETLAGADAMAWAFVGDRVLVGGHPGLYVSEDGGRTFEQRNDALPATDIHALGASKDVIVAASPAAGTFASYDEGDTWETLNADVGRSFMGRILVNPADPRHLVAPDMRAGAVESIDGGRTWRALGGVPAMWVSWDVADRDDLVVSGMANAASSTDGGRTWKPIAVPDGTQIVEMDPRNSATLFAAIHSGRSATIRVSRDGGRTWNAL